MTNRYLINDKCNFIYIYIYSLFIVQSYHDELSEKLNELVTDCGSAKAVYRWRTATSYSLSSWLYIIFAVYLEFLARCTAAVRHVVPCVSFIKASRSVSRALLDPNSNPGLEVERFDLTLTRSHWTMLLLSNCCCYSIKRVEL